MSSLFRKIEHQHRIQLDWVADFENGVCVVVQGGCNNDKSIAKIGVVQGVRRDIAAELSERA